MLEHVLKIQPLQEILEFQDWKRGYETYTKLIRNLYETYTKKKTFRLEIKPIIRNLQDQLYHCKTNKQKAQNLVLPSDGSLRAKNALKPFSKYLKEGICKIKQDLNLYWW